MLTISACIEKVFVPIYQIMIILYLVCTVLSQNVHLSHIYRKSSIQSELDKIMEELEVTKKELDSEHQKHKRKVCRTICIG